MNPTVIVRVTATEFETKDGRVYPHPIPFEPDDVPTVEEFQRQHDRWSKFISDIQTAPSKETPDENG